MATKTKAELEAYIAELEAKLNAKESVETDASAAKAAPVVNPTTPAYMYAPSTDVVVVYTSHSMGHMEGKLFSLDASVYGEEFTLSRGQFDELVGKYRHWFMDGILAVSYKNVDVAAAKGLPTDKDIGLSVQELRSLGTMTPNEIEDLWNKVHLDSLHMSIVTYFKEKYLEGAPGFRDRARIDCLNRLTNGGFDSEAQALSGRPVRLQPIDLITATED